MSLLVAYAVGIIGTTVCALVILLIGRLRSPTIWEAARPLMARLRHALGLIL
jgi:hypothetical protein